MTRRVRRSREPVEAKHDGDLFEYPGEPVVIGFDASLTKVGLSVLGAESLRHATLLFKPKLRGVARLQEIYEFTTDTVGYVDSWFDLQDVTLENYAMGIRGGKTFSIGEGGGAVKLALWHQLGARELACPTLVTPTALKKFVTGKGRVEKNQILLAVYRKWGVEFSNDDQADAYSLARVGLALLSGETEFEYEAEVVTQLERHTEWLKP